MKISELKEWINKLPEEVMDAIIVIRDLKEVEEGKFGHKDDPIASLVVDPKANRLAILNIDSAKVVEKIRQTLPKPEENTDASDSVQ